MFAHAFKAMKRCSRTEASTVVDRTVCSAEHTGNAALENERGSETLRRGHSNVSKHSHCSSVEGEIPSTARLLLQLMQMSFAVCSAELSMCTDIVEGLGKEEVRALCSLSAYMNEKLPLPSLRLNDLLGMTCAQPEKEPIASVNIPCNGSPDSSQDADAKFILKRLHENAARPQGSTSSKQANFSAVVWASDGAPLPAGGTEDKPKLDSAKVLESKRTLRSKRNLASTFHSNASASSVGTVGTNVLLDRLMARSSFDSNPLNTPAVASLDSLPSLGEKSGTRGASFSMYECVSDRAVHNLTPVRDDVSFSTEGGGPLQAVSLHIEDMEKVQGSEDAVSLTDQSHAKPDGERNFCKPDAPPRDVAQDDGKQQNAQDAMAQWRERRALKRKNRDSSEKVTYGAILRNAHEQCLD
eukprot:TRINITY_DN43116_c0_g1_i1.p1 TRINITY_DN43116_c0_g1~~TRINITY_DN43116_c0_g1_i1.p1  ORF type:complete len:412 (+),score=38.55 TRINITY_DN43116_c0_g1_i1:54-1289(+)